MTPKTNMIEKWDNQYEHQDKIIFTEYITTVNDLSQHYCYEFVF